MLTVLVNGWIKLFSPTVSKAELMAIKTKATTWSNYLKTRQCYSALSV